MNALLNKVINRIKNMIGKAIISSVLDEDQIQLLKLEGMEGETIDRVERVQNFGHTSNPPAGGEVIILSLGGNKNHPVAIVADSGEYRKKGLKPGESALYDKSGSFIYLKEDGSIIVSPSGGKYNIVSGNINLGAETLSPLAGVVTGECLDPVTGVPFPDKSSVVFAKK